MEVINQPPLSSSSLWPNFWLQSTSTGCPYCLINCSGQSWTSFPCTLRNLLVPTQLLIGFEREVNCWSFQVARAANFALTAWCSTLRRGRARTPATTSTECPTSARAGRRGREPSLVSRLATNFIALEWIASEVERGYKVEAMEQQFKML